MSQHYVSDDQGLDGIQQAIDTATAGDVVVCKPGVYEGDAALRLKSGVDLVSEAGAKKTILRQHVVNGTGVILAHKCENILIDGFHLGQKTGVFDDIKSGRGWLITIQLSDNICVRNNIIEYSNGNGINYFGSRGSVSGNLISNNKENGIYITSSEGNISEVTIDDGNTIEGNKGTGVVYASSKGNVRGNLIEKNEWGGLYFTGKSEVTIADRNTIRDNGNCGVQIVNQSEVIIEGENTIEGNKGQGVVYAGSKGNVRGNIIANNEGLGVEISGESVVTVGSGNTIKGNKGGVAVLDKSEVIIGDGNTIEENKGCGIIYINSTGNVRANAIANNEGIGVQVRNKSEVSITDGNMIEGSKGCGVAYDDSTGNVYANTIVNNEIYGVGYENSKGNVRANVIASNQENAIYVFHQNSSSETVITDNLIYRNTSPLANNNGVVYFQKNLLWETGSTELNTLIDNKGFWHEQYDELHQNAAQKFVRAGLGWGALEDVRDALPKTEEIHLDTSHLSGMSYQPTDNATGFDSKPHAGWPTSLSGNLHRLLQCLTHERKHGKHDAPELPDCIVVLEAGILDQYENELMKHAEIKWPKKADDLVYWEMVNGSSEADSGSSKEDEKSVEKSPESRLGMAMQENDQPRLKSLFFSMLVRAILLYLVPILVVFSVALYVEPVWIQPALQGLFSLGIGEYILVILASWLLFTHFIIPPHINIIPQKIIDFLDAISTGFVTAVANLLTPNMLIRFRERLWIEQRFFRRWPIFGKRKMVVLFWDDVDSTNKKDIEYIELIRDLAQKNGVPFLLFVSLHDAGLLPVCLPRIRDNYSGKFIPWMVLKESAGLIVPHEGLGSQDIIQHLFGSRKNILPGAILNTSNIDPTDMPLLLALASRYRLPLRYGFPIEPIDEDNPDFTGVVRKPSFVDVQTWLENTISNGKKWPVKKPIHEECYKSLPGEGYENGRWVWCHSQSITLNKDDKTQCSWQVLVTRPAYRQVVRKALENWKLPGSESSVYADVFHVHLDVAVGETIYLNWAMCFLQEGANGELDDDQRELAYAYASLALHSATDCLREKDATNHFPKLYDLRGKVIEAFLQSDHPEPERIAGLLLQYSGFLGDDAKEQEVRANLALMLKVLNGQFHRLRAATDPINEVETFEPTACALIEKLNADLTHKIDTLLFSSPNLASALFRRFKSVYWFWLKGVPDVEVPQEYEPRASGDLKHDFYDMWMRVWEKGASSEAVARNMGRRCAHAPVESVAAMIGSAKWYVQRRVRLETKPSDDSLNTLAGPEVFALSRLFTRLMKEWNATPQISDATVLDRLPFFKYWPEFREAMQKEEEYLESWSQPPAIQLEGVGYGMGRNEDVHQIEWYRDGRLVELVE